MPKNSSLLTEYQVCNDRIEFSAMTCWQASAILVGASLAGAALFATLTHGKLSTLLISLLVGGAIVFVLYNITRLFRREKWRAEVIYNRMREIELGLQAKVTWDIHILDLLKRNPAALHRLTPAQKTRYGHLGVMFPSPGPYGWCFLYTLVWVVIVLWTLLILAEIAFYLMNGFGFALCNPWLAR